MTETKTPSSETPYNLEVDASAKNGSAVDTQEVGFYIAKNWFAKKNFHAYPRGQKAYKPVFLKDLDNNLWKEFNRDIQHHQRYFAEHSWSTKFWTLAPPIWFLTMILPDLLWYYEIMFKGVGLVIGIVLALTFSLDIYLQRDLMSNKIEPMYSLLIGTYKATFLKHGYVLRYVLEPTTMDGMCSYIVFRKASEDEQSMVEVLPQQSGFYIDENILGSMPFARGVASMSTPPHFLEDLDRSTWNSFAKDVEDRKKTPLDYFRAYTIGMSLVVLPFVGALVYAITMLSNIRHWLFLALFPLFALIQTVVGFWRRHYVENVQVEDMRDLLKKYEGAFAKAGYGASFELEYMYQYCFLNTYMLFWQQDINPSSGGTPGEMA